MGIEIGKAGANQALSLATARAAGKAVADQTKARHVIRSPEGQIRKYSQRLGQEGLRKAQIRKAQNIMQRSSAQVARQQQTLQQAGRVAKVAGAAKIAVPLVFAAIDIWGAWTDYDETIRSL